MENEMESVNEMILLNDSTLQCAMPSDIFYFFLFYCDH